MKQLITLLCLLFFVSASFAGDKPNVIIFLVDDLGYGDLGYTGHPVVETPNIDHYASQGLMFTDAYAAAPECSPTRISILTGKYPARLGITSWIPLRPAAKSRRYRDYTLPGEGKYLDTTEYTIAEALRDNGYTTCHIGKWHVGGNMAAYNPDAHGFDHTIGMRDAAAPGAWFAPYRKELNLQTITEGEYITDRLTGEAIQFIRENRDGPFFLNLWHYAVHGPHMARQDKIEKYQLRAGVAEDKRYVPFQAMKESVDDSFGQIMDCLEELGINNNTIVVFFSDNGGVIDLSRNLPFRQGKKTTYEGGIREPMFICYPELIDEPGKTSARVSSIDFYPTILELTGSVMDREQVFDGCSFAGVITGQSFDRREPLFFHHLTAIRNGPSSVVMEGNYKLIHLIGQERFELYDLKNDPGETTDLFEKLPGQAAGLKQKLLEWRDSNNLQMPVKNP